MSKITSAEEYLERAKGGPCVVCGQPHKITTQCSRLALAARITKLQQAAAMVPQILEMHTEAMMLAKSNQVMLQKADEAHAILMDVLASHGEIGEEIRNEYMGRLDKWAASGVKPTSQGISGLQGDLFNPDQSISPEIETKSFTIPPSGTTFDAGFSQSTPSAIAAEKERP